MKNILSRGSIPALCLSWFLAFTALPGGPAFAGQTITINGTVAHEVFGNGNPTDGAAPGGDPLNLTNSPDNNTVNITGSGTVNNNVSGGHVIDNASGPITVSGNTVNNSGAVNGLMYGGSSMAVSGSSTISGNSATNNGAVDGTVYGGASTSVDGPTTATGNSASNSGTITGSLYGAHASSAFNSSDVQNNSATNSGTVDGPILGGYAHSIDGSATSRGNTVTHSGGTVGRQILGGMAATDSGPATASGNSAFINGGTVNGDIFGGRAQSDSGTGTVSGNSVTINSGGTVKKNVFGGYAQSDSGSASVAASGNSVANSGSAEGILYGAFAQSDSGTVTATGNSAINSGSVRTNMFGVFAKSDSGPATATGNSAINSGTVGALIYGAFVQTVSGSAGAQDNSVVINGGTVSRDVYGAFVQSTSGTTVASGNSVTVSGGTMDRSVLGGHARSDTATASATGNSVVISGGTVNGGVTGGSAFSSSGQRTATGNSVTITGGTVNGFINGGIAATNTASPSLATDNTVTLGGNPTFGAGTQVRGGWTDNNGDAFTGNRLNVWDYSGGAVKSVYNFQYLNFLLPAGIASGDTVLSVTDTVTVENGSGVSSTVEAVDFVDGGRAPGEGESFTLIHADNGIVGTIANNGRTLTGRKGAALIYDIRVDQLGGDITATILDAPRTNPQMKAVSEGFLAGLILVNQGADLIAGPGMSNAVSAAARMDYSGKTYGPAIFGALSGGWSRYDTGSHVDMSSISLLAGLAWGRDLRPGRLTLGAFFEYGNGSYDAYNSFSNAASVHGSGDVYHIGGGILGRMDFKPAGPGHFYVEASARGGSINSEHKGGNLRDGLGRAADYDSSSAYYGLHLGTGYVWEISEAASLDLYGKYFWTRQEGDSVRLSTEDPVTFKDADSHRLRVGSRFSYAVNEYVTPWIGAAYEHEFEGDTRATTYGHAISKPSLDGGTGIGEIGLTLTPSQTLPLSIDLGAQGYTGTREGVSGSVQVKFEF